MDRTYRIVKAVARVCLRLYPRRFLVQQAVVEREVVVHRVVAMQAEGRE